MLTNTFFVGYQALWHLIMTFCIKPDKVIGVYALLLMDNCGTLLSRLILLIHDTDAITRVVRLGIRLLVNCKLLLEMHYNMFYDNLLCVSSILSLVSRGNDVDLQH